MRFELSDHQQELAREVCRDLRQASGGTTTELASWAGVTIPGDLGGWALGQAGAVIVAEQLGLAGRDGTLLDLIAAAECLADAPRGDLAARVLRELFTGT